MSYLSSDVLDRSSDGFAVVGKDDKLSIKDDHQHPTVVRSEVGQVGLDATSRGVRVRSVGQIEESPFFFGATL